MNSTFAKILSYGIIGVVIVLTIVGLFSGMPSSDTEEFEPNMLFYIVYGLVGLAIAGVIFGAVLGSITNPKAALIPGAGIGLLFVIFKISEALASDDNAPFVKLYPEITGDLSQFIGGILILTYILLALAFGAIIFAWAKKVVR